MTTFRAFLKILQKNLPTIIISTLILLIFGSINISSENSAGDFIDDKPDITIINRDGDSGIASGLIEYLNTKANLIELPDDEIKLKDALFYRDTNFIIYIPEHYGADFLAGGRPEISYQGTGDYQAALAEMLLARYLEVAEVYRTETQDAVKLNTMVADTLNVEVATTMTSQLDLASTSRAARYFNFESYALLNSLVFVITMVMVSFNNPKVHRRLLVSRTSPSSQNRILLFANLLFAGVMWLLYLLMGFVILGGDALWSLQGVCFMLSSFIFMLVATSVAFLIGTLVHNKEAINGIVNVVALGSSFLCGAFVPQVWLPDSVLGFAHIFPTYYYIDANNAIAELETLDQESLSKLLFNFGMMLMFTLMFALLANILPRILRKLKQ